MVITSTLNWNTQCEEVKKKANKVLGVHLRNLSFSTTIKERAYLTLPSNQQAVGPTVSKMIYKLGWVSLKVLRDWKDVELFYKIHYNLVDIIFPIEIVPGSLRTRGHDLRYRQLACAVNPFKFSFFSRTIPSWNSLPRPTTWRPLR